MKTNESKNAGKTAKRFHQLLMRGLSCTWCVKKIVCIFAFVLLLASCSIGGGQTEITTLPGTGAATTTSQPANPTATKTPADELSAKIASLTNEDGSGQIALDMPYSKVKQVLDAAGIEYKSSALAITFEDGSAYAFAQAAGEPALDHFYFTQSPKGLLLGDSPERVQQLYGEAEHINFNGESFYLYHFDDMELLAVMSDSSSGAVVKQIMLNYKRYGITPSNYGINAPANADIVSMKNAAADNAQKKIVFDENASAKEKFVQIAESQVGYVSGQADGGGVRFPFFAVDGWTKYSYDSFGIGTVAWCATFISWCADKADIPKADLERSTWANMNEDRMTAKPEHKPERGDLVYFRYRENMQTNHIGIVTAVENGWMFVVEGNGRNSGKRGYCIAKAYRLDNVYVKGTSRF